MTKYLLISFLVALFNFYGEKIYGEEIFGGDISGEYASAADIAEDHIAGVLTHIVTSQEVNHRGSRIDYLIRGSFQEYLRPSGQQYETQLGLDQLSIFLQQSLESHVSILIEAKALSVPTTENLENKKPSERMDRAPLSIYLNRGEVHFGDKKEGILFGKIENPIISFFKKSLSDSYAIEGVSVGELMGYFKPVESGLSLSYTNEEFCFSASVFQGDGVNGRSSQGSKDFLGLITYSNESIQASLGYAQGLYLDYGPFNRKTRLIGSAEFKNDVIRLGFLKLQTEDPADAVTDFQLSEGVELSQDLPGQKASGEGYSAWTEYLIKENYKIGYKYDSFNPSKELGDRRIQIQSLYLQQKLRESTLISLYYSRHEYAELHSRGIRDNGRIGVSLELKGILL